MTTEAKQSALDVEELMVPVPALGNCRRCKGHGRIEVTEWGRDCRPTTFRIERCPACDGYGCHRTRPPISQ